MTRSSRSRALVGLFACAILPLTGCGGGGSTAGNFSLASQTWRTTSVRGTTGSDQPCPAAITIKTTPLQVELACEDNDMVTFNANGTFVGAGSNIGVGGTWSVSGNELTMTSTIDKGDGTFATEVSVYTISGSGSTLRLTQKSITIDGSPYTDLNGTSLTISAVS